METFSWWGTIVSVLSFKDTRLLRNVIYFLGALLLLGSFMNRAYNKGIDDTKKSIDKAIAKDVPLPKILNGRDSLERFSNELRFSVSEIEIRKEYSNRISESVEKFENNIPDYSSYFFYSGIALFVIWGISLIKDYFKKHVSAPIPEDANNDTAP